MPNKCHMCKREEESSDHMILHCSKARIMWSLVFTLYGMTWGNALFNKRKPTKFDMVLL